MATYTVKSGDCLWNIARAQLGNPYRWTEIANLNNISTSRPIIREGQVLTLPGSSSSTTSTTNKTNIVSINYFGLQAGSERAMFAAWTWSRANTENFRVMWKYYANGLWWVGSDSTTKDATTEYMNSTYTAPQEATMVSLKVLPISTKKSDDDDVRHWTADWSTEKAATYNFSNNPPSTPPIPEVSIDGYTLTAEINNIDMDALNATAINFEIVQDDARVFTKHHALISMNRAAYSCQVEGGARYKVRAVAFKSSMYSDWSEYSENKSTIPHAPTTITTCKAKTETSAYLAWEAVPTATSYTIEYATKREYFDGSSETTSQPNIKVTFYEITGLEGGSEYFFRIKATNSAGDSGWSEIVSTTVGTVPTAPTTWSSTTTAIVGEPLSLTWMHNCEDGSGQTYAELELTIDGIATTYTIIPGDTTRVYPFTTVFDDEYITGEAILDTNEYVEGVEILWRVRTAGATKTYGDSSILRTVTIYAPPTLSLSVTNFNGDAFDELSSFPIKVHALAGPKTQAPIGYYLSISSTESYETVDNIGNRKIINSGESVYSRYFDINTALSVDISAGDVNLVNNVTYVITCLVTMDSGLTKEETHQFQVAWTDDMYDPNAEITIDKDTLAAYIRPYCEDENGDLIEGVLLSVYRREFDGGFVELATNLVNTKVISITDPHPALDYARYRIVAMTESTGSVSFYDMPGYPVGEKAIVIQWNEEWSNYNNTNEAPVEEPTWAGSMLKLPYNVDVSDNYGPDISLIEYIGRKRPVGYYGTHLGETSSWSTVIPKSDTETLYALRRLAIWMDNVYVREPSGSGYWANISVSFSQKHLDLTIPVSFSITRVEGGV